MRPYKAGRDITKPSTWYGYFHRFNMWHTVRDSAGAPICFASWHAARDAAKLEHAKECTCGGENHA
jgi:hypothetical protein